MADDNTRAVDWYICPKDNSKMQFWNGCEWEEKYRPNPRSYRTFKVTHYSPLMFSLKVLIVLAWLVVILFMGHLSYTWETCLLKPLVPFSLNEQRLFVLIAVGFVSLGYILRWVINQAEYPNGK